MQLKIIMAFFEASANYSRERLGLPVLFASLENLSIPLLFFIIFFTERILMQNVDPSRNNHRRYRGYVYVPSQRRVTVYTV